MTKDRIYGVVGTVVFHGLVLLLFLLTYLTYPPKDMEAWPPMEDEREIVFEEVEPLYSTGEYVRRGDMPDMVPTHVDEPAPSAETTNEPPQNGPDLKNVGKAAEPRPVVASKQPSPAKVEKKEKGPTKEEIAAEKARQEAKRQAQARKTAEEATRKAFGGKGKGTPGQTDGNSASALATSGTPGNGLKGRTLEHFERVPSTKIGQIAIRVKVDSSGRVVSATYSAQGSEGAVAGDVAMRNRCIAQSRQCRFSVMEGSQPQSGIITWKFK